jgi:hypothetical protein
MLEYLIPIIIIIWTAILIIYAYRETDRKGLQTIYILIGLLIFFILFMFSYTIGIGLNIVKKLGIVIILFPLFIYELEINKLWYLRASYILLYCCLVGFLLLK